MSIQIKCDIANSESRVMESHINMMKLLNLHQGSSDTHVWLPKQNRSCGQHCQQWCWHVILNLLWKLLTKNSSVMVAWLSDMTNIIRIHVPFLPLWHSILLQHLHLKLMHSTCAVVMGQRRYFKSISVFRYIGRYFFKSVWYLLSVFPNIAIPVGIFSISLCVKAPRADSKILLPSQFMDFEILTEDPHTCSPAGRS